MVTTHSRNKKLFPPSIRIFFFIARYWRLSEEEQRMLLGSPRVTVFAEWKKYTDTEYTVPIDIAPEVLEEVLTRILYIEDIHDVLGILFHRKTEFLYMYLWVENMHPHPSSEERVLIQRLFSGDVHDFGLLRDYLYTQYCMEYS